MTYSSGWQGLAVRGTQTAAAPTQPVSRGGGYSASPGYAAVPSVSYGTKSAGTSMAVQGGYYAAAPTVGASRRSGYSASPGYAAAPTASVSYGDPYRAPSSYTTRAGSAISHGRRRRSLDGLGQITIETGVSRNWKYAALACMALLGVQFWWWNKKAPQVLKLGY